MKKIVLALLTTGIAATLIAGEEKKACEETECAAACAAKAKALEQVNALPKVQLKVANVGCEESCGALSKTIAALEGVKAQSVCGKSQVATISYEKGKTCSKTITAALQKAGYKIEGQQVSLKVKGLTCGGCSSGLSAAFTKLDGVLKNDVCHESGSAQVLFNPEKVDAKQILAVVVKEGYSVVQ